MALLTVATACGRYGFDQLEEDGDGVVVDAAVVDAAISPWSATHQGWDAVSAVGTRTPKQTAQVLDATSLRVEIAWKAMTITPLNTIDTYKVSRSESPGGPYTLLGAAEPQPSGGGFYVDNTTVPETTYYYLVRASVGGFVLTPSGPDAELQVMTPPNNMALVHRWMANQEVCGLLNSTAQGTSDRNENYRCPYTGPGRIGYAGDVGDPPATEAFYDLGAHYFVDIVETGCNYTLVSAGCPQIGGAPGPCLGNGNAAPDNVANDKGGLTQAGLDGDVFYDRGSSLCYHKAGTTWTSIRNSSGGSLSTMASNSPGLPPLVMIDQTQSSSVCQSRSQLGVTMQLPSRKLQIAASAWPPELSVQQIKDIESGIGLSDCNSDLGHAGEVVFNAEIEPTDYATLPGTTANVFRLLRSGSNKTRSCTSRYGIQDWAGNAWEWGSDQFIASGAGTVCTGVTSNLDPENKSVTDLVVARSYGGGGSAWDHAAAAQVIPVLGLPAENTPAWQAALATSEFELYDDRLFMEDSVDGLRASYVGGSASSNTWAGRFSLNLSRSPSTEHQRIGFRCAVRLSP